MRYTQSRYMIWDGIVTCTSNIYCYWLHILSLALRKTHTITLFFTEQMHFIECYWTELHILDKPQFYSYIYNTTDTLMQTETINYMYQNYQQTCNRKMH